MPSNPSIATTDLARRFGTSWALDGLTLEAEAGEVIALLGPNGAGKTTTVRILDGVLAPHRGQVRVLGLDPMTEGTELRRRTGVLTEAGGLDDRLTLTENLLTHARIRKIDPDEARARTGELLERFGMSALADRPAQGLSTGERKRVSLARALLHRPDVLLLDEPTSGLDPAATRDVLDLIAGLAGQGGATVVLCTHFLAEAARLCRRVAILEAGRLLAFGGADRAGGVALVGSARRRRPRGRGGRRSAGAAAPGARRHRRVPERAGRAGRRRAPRRDPARGGRGGDG